MSANRMLPHDQALPSLAVAFDCERMGRILQDVIDPDGSSGVRVVDCSIARSKYRLGRNCMMLYRASISDGRSGSPHEQLFSCGIYSAEEALARYRKARAESLVTPRFGPSLAHVPAHNMVIWAYPNERKLNALPLLADEERLRSELLPEVVEARWGTRRPIESISTSIAGYFPEHACCIRVNIRFSDRREADDWVVFGKTSFDDRGADTFAAMHLLRQSEAHRLGRLGMARPLCYQAAHRLIWQEGVPGQTVESLLLGGALAPPLLARAGSAIGELHCIGLPGLRVVHTSDVLAAVYEGTRQLGLAVPSLAGRLQQLAHRLADNASVGDSMGQSALHGDLHLNNMLADGHELYLVNFDSLRQGTPAIELGSFVAALHYRAALHGMAEQDALAGADAFLCAYDSVVGRRISRREIAWHTAAALIHERMSRCLTSLKPGRFELLNDLLARAEALCADSLTLSRRAVFPVAQGAVL